jgi:hypothetical protein
MSTEIRRSSTLLALREMSDYTVGTSVGFHEVTIDVYIDIC